MFSNILLDLDGTLTDPKAGMTRCFQLALSQLGLTPPHADQLEWCIGPPLKQSFARLLNTKDATRIDQAIFNYRKEYSTKGMFENVVYPGAIPFLQRIKSTGLHVYLATSKPRVIAIKILDHFKLTSFFDAVYGSGLDDHLTDKGDLVAHILDSEKLDPVVTLIVGDRFYDVISGKKNGIMTAAVTYGYGTLQELTSSAPDFMFDNISELQTFIESKAKPGEASSG